MPAAQPPSGMRPCFLFRVEEDHLGWPEFTEHFSGTDGRRTLINFHSNRTGQAYELPSGTRLLVWVRESRRFFADLQLDGKVAEGRAACKAHGFQPDGSRHGANWGRFYRPVRILARTSPPFDSGTTLDEVRERCGVAVKLVQSNTQEIDANEYAKLIRAIDWAS